MIPSVIARQIQRGVEDFLLTTFPITNPFFAGTLEKLHSTPGMLFRGPYLSVKLPFMPADDGPRPFPEILPQSFPPYRHQQQAGSGWTRAWAGRQSSPPERGPARRSAFSIPFSIIASDSAGSGESRRSSSIR